MGLVSLALGAIGLVCVRTLLASPTPTVQNKSAGSLLGCSALCSLLGLAMAIVAMARSPYPEWPAILGLFLSAIPLVLCVIAFVAALAMSYDS
jgi:hypothetical protein